MNQDINKLEDKIEQNIELLQHQELNIKPIQLELKQLEQQYKQETGHYYMFIADKEKE